MYSFLLLFHISTESEFKNTQKHLSRCKNTLRVEMNNNESRLHPVCPSDGGGCNGEECGLYFCDEEMTPKYDIPPCEEGVGRTQDSSGKYQPVYGRHVVINKHSADSPLMMLW